MNAAARVAGFRVGVALMALTILPLRYPGFASDRWLLGAYVLWTMAMVVLIHYRVGDRVRPLVGGLVDMAVISYLSHRAGSTTSILPALYLLSGMMTALVVSFRVGVGLAIAGSAMYAATLTAEHVGLLAFAPAAEPWQAEHPPPTGEVVAVSIVVATVMMVSTVMVASLVRANRRHEAELERKNAQLEELSQRDALTQLHNRRHMVACLGAELERVRRGRALAVLMIDLDGFKRINDTQGHTRGDLLLQELAAALLQALRRVDIAGRHGGDEFVVVLPDTTAEQARGVAERIVVALAEVGTRFDRARPVTASIGVAIAHPTDTLTELLDRADACCYEAKHAGGNRAVLAG